MPQSHMMKVSFWSTTIGQKAVVAATGIILSIYVLDHLVGNLLIFGGRSTINGYARLLHARAGLLWTARAILFVTMVLHIIASTQLWWLNKHIASPHRVREEEERPACLRFRADDVDRTGNRSVCNFGSAQEFDGTLILGAF